MFKRFALIVVAFVSLGLLGGCITDGHLSALGDAYTAATISNEELIELSRQMRAEGDKQANVASKSNKYGKRLDRLTKRFQEVDGHKLNYKVYLTNDVNANATADGSIRFYSGLMDLMTDNELLFVLGHEIGHVVDGDSLDKIRLAYGASAARKGAASANKTAAAVLNSSELGDLLEAVLNAQFSQKQESDADKYAYAFMKKYKIDTKAAVSALQKLGGGGTDIMSTHPGSADRAKTIQAMIDADAKK
ncbi:MAG: Metalloprotease YcaL [Desulfovibrio sp.]